MYKLPFALIGVAVIILAFFLFREYSAEEPVFPQETASYENQSYGISFGVPEGYVQEEREVGDLHRGHYVITLTRAEDVAVPENGEGPTGITIDIYQNDIDKQTLLNWLTMTSFSNYKLGNGTYASTSIDGTEAVRYKWSGLYEGETTAFLHGDSIIAVSVTRLSPSDHTDAYELVLEILTLE